MSKAAKSTGLIFLSLLITFVSLAKPEVTVDSRIAAVTVYLRGAWIERTASLAVPAGSTTLRFEGLSPSLDPASISVKGEGTYTIMSVQHRLDHLAPEQESPAYKMVEDSLGSMTYALKQSMNGIAVLNEEQSLLLSNKSIGGSQTGVTAAELARVADYVRARLGKIRQQLLDRELARDSLQEVVSRLQSQLAILKSKGRRTTSTISVEVSSDRSVKGTLFLKYITPQASWTPFYDIRSDGSGPVQLAYKAHVSQQTGVRWDGVELTLSTGNPMAAGSLPELRPWYLSFRRPRPVLRNAVMDMQEMQPAEMKKPPLAAGDAASLVEVMENRLSTDFRIRAKSTIPPDGKTHTVTVRHAEVPAGYSHACVPKLDPGVFLVARLTGWQDLGLLPGKAFVYLDGAYTGTSPLDPFATEDTLLFSLGRDPRVVTERRQARDFTSTKTFGGNRVRSFGYVITVRNTTKENVRLALEDQVPVSRDKDITVKAEELSGGNLDPETGRVTWQQLLAPGEKQEWRITFTVRYPKDKTVGGL